MQKSKTKILYFHGGGLFTGHKNDLPKIYQQKLHDLNYEVIGFNYPLAPHASLDDILKACTDFVTKHNQSDYILYGRSAGAYLAINTLENLYLNHEKLPTKLISFYGYENFSHPSFSKPRPSSVSIKFDQIKQFIDQKSNSDPLYHRALLYHYARQEGKWLDLISDENQLKHRQCTILTSNQMPATFLAHSANDDDVPYSESKKLNQKISDSTLHTVYYLNHEFDLELNDPQTISVMNALWQWLE